MLAVEELTLAYGPPGAKRKESLIGTPAAAAFLCCAYKGKLAYSKSYNSHLVFLSSKSTLKQTFTACN